jgi:hypothetical protein
VAFLWYSLGVLVIAAGLADVFLNVLAYDAAGLPVERSYRVIWRAVRAATRHLPAGLAGLLRALGAPLMVVWTIAGWIGLLILGFALIYYPGVTDGALRHPGLPSSFWTPLYFSAAMIGGLSFSDTQPEGLPLHFWATAETIIGFSVFTLGITFVLGLYQVVQKAGAVWASLQHHADTEADPRALLRPHFRAGAAEGLPALWRDLDHSLTAYMEGMRRYPVVYYFHVRHRYRSLPSTFRIIGTAASAVCWGLPASHPVAGDPWLPGLLEGYRQAMRDIETRFITVPVTALDGPAERARFVADRADGRSAADSVADFLELERYMAALAGTLVSPDHAEAYDRYRQWWSLTAASRAFVRAVSADFGIEPAAAGGAAARRS